MTDNDDEAGMMEVGSLISPASDVTMVIQPSPPTTDLSTSAISQLRAKVHISPPPSAQNTLLGVGEL